MSKVAVIISNSFEEIETATVIDILRRAKLTITISAVKGINTIAAHNISLKAAKMIEHIA